MKAPRINRSLEMREILSKDFSDTPLQEVLTHFAQRAQYHQTLQQALELIGFSHFANEIFIGEVTPSGQVRLLTRHASIISRVKNKLPSILHFFREAGFQVCEIQLKISPGAQADAIAQEVPPNSPPLQMTDTQMQSWETLLKETDPESPTFDAIQKLLSSAKKHRQRHPS